MSSTWIGIALGGALGSLLRYAFGGWIQHASGGTFPWGTLAINVAGCAAIGALTAYADRGGLLSPAWRMALQVGVLGGFTTFSSFGLETFRLVSDGDFGRAAAYFGATNAAGFAAVWIAYRLMERA
ncbi:MAG: fluoride efflux transporter CrcB [Candidatus Eisenbacteria bacterium]